MPLGIPNPVQVVITVVPIQKQFLFVPIGIPNPIQGVISTVLVQSLIFTFHIL